MSGDEGAGKPDFRARVRRQARAEVARIAFDLFAEQGFESTTAAEAAAAAGISRASFFRLFSSKEEAVLLAQEATGERLAEALADRPSTERTWTALREAFLTVTGEYLEDPASALAHSRMVRETPSLRAHQLELRGRWAEAIEAPLADRLEVDPASLEVRVLAGAAVASLDGAMVRWGESGGDEDLLALVERTFGILENLDSLS